MLNEDWKTNFIQTTGLDYTQNSLKLIADYEEYLNKDLSLFTIDEIMGFYKSLCSSSYMYVANQNYAFTKYTYFCLENNLVPDGQNHYDEITDDMIRACLNNGLISNKILTKEELEDAKKILPNLSDKCLVLALFEGIMGQRYGELSDLDMSQLHGDTLHLKTRNLTISHELINLMQESTDMYDAEPYKFNEREYRKKFDEADKRVFKQYKGANGYSKNGIEYGQSMRIERRLRRIKIFMDGSRAFTAVGLRDSGRLNMIKELMHKEGTSAYDTILAHRTEIESRYSKIASIKNYLLMYENYLY